MVVDERKSIGSSFSPVQFTIIMKTKADNNAPRMYNVDVLKGIVKDLCPELGKDIDNNLYTKTCLSALTPFPCLDLLFFAKAFLLVYKVTLLNRGIEGA